MSSVAVLTQESFAEHRSGLAQQQVKGELLSCASRSRLHRPLTQAHSMCLVPQKYTFPFSKLVFC